MRLRSQGVASQTQSGNLRPKVEAFKPESSAKALAKARAAKRFERNQALDKEYALRNAEQDAIYKANQEAQIKAMAITDEGWCPKSPEWTAPATQPILDPSTLGLRPYSTGTPSESPTLPTYSLTVSGVVDLTDVPSYSPNYTEFCLKNQ